MDYFINPAAFGSAFVIPSDIVDKHLKLAKGEHIKVLLFVLKNISDDPSLDEISTQTGVSEYDVNEALIYFSNVGILTPKHQPQKPTQAEPTAVVQSLKPSRTDVARRGNEDPKIRYLLREAGIKLGRNLKTNETSTLVWLYDDQGLDISLILLIIQYAVQHNKANIRFIESVAVNWLNNGIETITQADAELKNMALGEQAFGIVCSAFGLERRKPSAKETELCNKWINEWKLSPDLLSAAYEECVNQKSKFSFSYTAKIIENWHKKGIQSVEDIKEKPKKEASSPSFDLDLFQQMINSKD